MQPIYEQVRVRVMPHSASVEPGRSPKPRKPAWTGLACMHAQLSIEVLLIFSLFLSLSAIAYFATSKIGAASQERVSFELSRSSFLDFSGRLSSACAMGEGNIRTVAIKGAPAAIRADGREYSFSAGKFFATENSSCEISVSKTGASDTFTIANIGGQIEIS